MDRLKWLYQFVKHKIDNNERCDPNIYIVLSGGFTGNCQTGDLLVVIINKIRESAYLTKRVDYPNLVLVQYAESVPGSSSQIVFWTNPAYSEYAESQWKDLINLFDGPSVLNPFLQCDGFLTNQYGPERMRVDFNPTGHESKHRLFYDSIEHMVHLHYNHFSTFQNLILLLFQAQHCDECLLIILNSLRTSEEIENFVWKVGRGVWSPKEKRDMDRCIAWVDDNNQLYSPRCWRYNLQDEVQPQTSHMTQNDIRLGQVLLPSPPPPTESPPYYNDRRDFVGNAQYHPQASVPSHADPRLSYNKVSTLAPPVLLQSAPEPSLKRLTDVIQIV
ncbi:hypothetical protein CRE_06184 [Caenorhabditis remanei]|uniref:Uncharacterized protein n=1 Tax=Caenorhabditis remanei TaxID=31234 RepID=E3NKP7_CAERE|nr:hypothetical protein CRE_06184 [Caenorhabditis remanei]